MKRRQTFAGFEGVLMESGYGKRKCYGNYCCWVAVVIRFELIWAKTFDSITKYDWISIQIDSPGYHSSRVHELSYLTLAFVRRFATKRASRATSGNAATACRWSVRSLGTTIRPHLRGTWQGVHRQTKRKVCHRYMDYWRYSKATSQKNYLLNVRGLLSVPIQMNATTQFGQNTETERSGVTVAQLASK
jgi:hypothetical protein